MDLWYQKATPYLTSAGWIPVQNAIGVTQQLTGLSLGAGADGWFAVDDGMHHNHWCVKAVVTLPGDPNADNKIAFRNFNNVVVGGPDTRFDTLIRFADWIEGDRIQIVPRGPAATLVIANPEAFPKPVPRGCDPRASERWLIHSVPLHMIFAQLRVSQVESQEWDREHFGAGGLRRLLPGGRADAAAGGQVERDRGHLFIGKAVRHSAERLAVADVRDRGTRMALHRLR